MRVDLFLSRPSELEGVETILTRLSTSCTASGVMLFEESLISTSRWSSAIHARRSVASRSGRSHLLFLSRGYYRSSASCRTGPAASCGFSTRNGRLVVETRRVAHRAELQLLRFFNEFGRINPGSSFGKARRKRRTTKRLGDDAPDPPERVSDKPHDRRPVVESRESSRFPRRPEGLTCSGSAAEILHRAGQRRKYGRPTPAPT